MIRRAPVLLLLAACASSSPGPEFGYVAPGGIEPAPRPAAPAAAPAPALAPAGNASCFFGGLYVTPAGAAESHQGELLIRLTFDRAGATMTEETFSFPLFERWRVTRTISGRRFTMRQDDGSFSGAGELDGDPGRWSAWHSTTTSADGATHVDASTRLVDGVLIAEEKVSAADGTLRDVLRYSLEPIGPAACDDMFARAQAAVDEARARAASRANP
ncbi:MAG TPA: hypothetical protein VL172_18415 [Kofleriaceae bacterium]|nr:hypothetical protein [Kofleriaceae bacterium]